MASNFERNLSLGMDSLLLDDQPFVVDLDTADNIGHPYWEFLDPNPDIIKEFQRLNDLFFDGQFNEKTVRLEWYRSRKGSKDAGRTFPPNRKGQPIRIQLNEIVLSHCPRKYIIETLAHEMIHAYLILNKKEDLQDSVDQFHCRHFSVKACEINEKTNLNIQSNHDYCEKNDMYVMWRCRGRCRQDPPYFGFVWSSDNSEPKAGDPMLAITIKCKHVFEKMSSPDDPKMEMTEWDCIRKFVNDTKHFIHVKTKLIDLDNTDQNYNFEDIIFDRTIRNESMYNHIPPGEIPGSDSAEDSPIVTLVESFGNETNGNVDDNTLVNKNNESSASITSNGNAGALSVDTNATGATYNISQPNFNGVMQSTPVISDRTIAINDGNAGALSVNTNATGATYNISQPNFNDVMQSSPVMSDRTIAINDTVINEEENPIEIDDKFFVNYDVIDKQLLNVDDLNEKFEFGNLNHLIVCIICEDNIMENEIVEHLKQCTGILYKLPDENSDATLPLFKIMKT